MKHNKTLKEMVQQNLSSFSCITQSAENLKRAAVAIVIAPDVDGNREQATFLLTRRTPRLTAHAGQWALPGGRLDLGETLVEAAYRELEEEVGLHPQTVGLLGVLDEYPTRSGYLITPVVLWADAPIEPRLNPAEVASLHHIPLAELQRPNGVEFLSIPESDRPVIRLYFLDDHIHAPTAALLHQFNEVAILGKDTRVAHLEQPIWAWT